MTPIHHDIADKPIQSIYELAAPFDAFARKETGASGPALWEYIRRTIRRRHGQAEATLSPNHPRTIWRLSTPHVYFYYQVLPNAVEVGDIVSTESGNPFEVSQDLLADFS